MQKDDWVEGSWDGFACGAGHAKLSDYGETILWWASGY